MPSGSIGRHAPFFNRNLCRLYKENAEEHKEKRVIMTTIAYIKQKNNGRCMLLGIEDGTGDILRLCISREAYHALGCPVRAESLTEDALELIRREDGRMRALDRALYLLSFSDNSRAQLAHKLHAKGFSSDAVTYAVEEVVRLGYLREREQLVHIVRDLANLRLYGARRICAVLTSKGYRSADVTEVIQDLCASAHIDFSKNFRMLEEKRGDGTPLTSRKLRYTYGYGETE